MLSRSVGMPSRNDRPPDIWDTDGISGNVFVNPSASSSAHYPQGFNPWISNVSEHTPPHVMSERQTPDTTLNPICQSGPSARNSVIPSDGGFSKNYGADQQRLQISDSHFDKFPTPATFACWKIRFKTEVCTCSQFPTEAMLWIKEVEMVNQWMMSNLRALSEEFLGQILKYSMRRLLQHWTESSITPASRKRSVWRKWKPKTRSVSLQIAYLIYEYFRVTGANDSVENYADLFTIVLRNDDIQEFDSKWDEILLPMTQIPSDDILEGLYKLRIRESDQLKTVWELYDLEIHLKKAGPDHHRLKTMVKRSTEQNLRMKNFEARNGNDGTNAVVKNQGTKQREQRSLGNCSQWKANGQCSKGDNCSFRHDMNKRAKSTQPNPSPRYSTQQNVKNASRTKSPRGKKPKWENGSTAVQGLPQRNLHQSILWKMASPRMLVLQVREWMQIWGKVLLCASPDWWTG